MQRQQIHCTLRKEKIKLSCGVRFSWLCHLFHKTALWTIPDSSRRRSGCHQHRFLHSCKALKRTHNLLFHNKAIHSDLYTSWIFMLPLTIAYSISDLWNDVIKIFNILDGPNVAVRWPWSQCFERWLVNSYVGWNTDCHGVNCIYSVHVGLVPWREGIVGMTVGDDDDDVRAVWVGSWVQETRM